MKILFKYPSRERPLKFFRALEKYYELLENHNDFQFIVTLDEDDHSMNNDFVKSNLDQFKNLKYFFGNSKNKIEAINADLKNQDFDILVLVSDDMIPEIKGFDNVIRDKMKLHYPNLDGVLWFFDGWRKDINTLCILGKSYYDRFGYIYHPSYKSFWCDNEFTDVANILKKQTFFDETIIRHLHPDIAASDKNAREKLYDVIPQLKNTNSYGHDSLWQRNSIPGDPDKEVYYSRKSKNFDLI
jgi:hypothetical protein